MSDDDRTWTATHDRTPYENLRALMRHIDPETPTTEILRLAFIRIPGLGETDEHIVETIHETFAEEHALARAQRWLDEQDKPSTITLDAERRLSPADTDGSVHSAEVRAVVAHRLGARPARTCENGTVIECNGPDEPGYRCPDCGQQRRREQAIIEALLDVADRERPTPRATEIETDDTTHFVTMTTATDESDECTNKTQTRSPTPTRTSTETDDTGQHGLDAFASGHREGNA